MRYRTTVVVLAALGTLIGAATPRAVRAESAKDKLENTMERAKDKAAATAKDAKTAVKDSWITAKTKIALFADERVKGHEVHVDTKDGVVELSGAVESGAAKQAAEEIARKIDGATSVRNELRVVPPTARETTRASDTQIARAVEARIAKDGELGRVDAHASRAGVVTLTGEVPNITAAARASEMARSVPGVNAVKNELTVLQAK
jgi:osmotically-inducible protein OsmY